MKARSSLALFSACLVLLGSRSARAQAQDTSDLQQLLSETVITTASKSAETGSLAPATSTIITAEDLRRYGVHSLDEALNYLSLGVMSSSSLTSTDVGARGVVLPGDQGSHILLLVDGHAINEPLFGAARVDRGAGIPFEMIDHIEVILGPGSVLYGSNAMLGVVNVITKRGKDWEGAHVVGEWEVGKSARAGAGVGWVVSRSIDVSFMADYYEQYGPGVYIAPQLTGSDTARLTNFRFHPAGPDDGIWGGNATQTPRAQVPSGLLRLTAGNFELDVGAKAFKRAAPTAASGLSGYTFYDDPDAYQIDRHVWIDARHRLSLSPIVQLTSRAYADSYDYQRTADTASGSQCLPVLASLYDGAPECRQQLVGTSRWAGIEEQGSFDWFKDASFVTLIGTDGRVRSVASKTDMLDYAAFSQGQTKYLASSSGVIDRSDGILGSYLEQTWRPTPWLGLNGGARLDFDPRFAPQVSPRVAATAHAWKGGTFKAIYAQAFRAPTFGESYYSNPNQLVAQNLRPETERSLEASFAQQIVGAHKVFMGVFATQWDDLIEIHQLTSAEIIAAQSSGQLGLSHADNAQQYRNVSSIDTYGFNAGVEGVSTDGALRYAANVTGTRATVDDNVLGPRPITVTPTIFGNARVSYDLPGALPTAGLAVLWTGRRPSDRAFGSGLTPPPFAPPLLELRATLSGDVPVVRGLSYRASIDWASTNVAPYVVGPIQSARDALNPQQPNVYSMAPMDTFRATVGLQWEFWQ